MGCGDEEAEGWGSLPPQSHLSSVVYASVLPSSLLIRLKKKYLSDCKLTIHSGFTIQCYILPICKNTKNTVFAFEKLHFKHKIHLEK